MQSPYRRQERGNAGRRQCEERGCSDASTSQGMPEIVSKQTEAKREAWTDSPSYSQKEVCVCVCVCVEMEILGSYTEVI